MKVLLFLSFFLLQLACAHAQQAVDHADGQSTPIKSITDSFPFNQALPQYPGGEQALLKFVWKHIKYPKIARQKGIYGKVTAHFIIDSEGYVKDPVIPPGKGLGWECDEEVIRVIKLMPRWKPATQNGEPVAAGYSLPVRFEMDMVARRYNE